MNERVDVLIVGGGPGGLACAADLAAGGVRVLLAERKAKIGAKVCAGGITWNGLIRLVPEALIEAAFPEQHIVTGRQRAVVAEANPIVATVNRERLGQWMAQRAAAAGADLRTALVTARSAPAHERAIRTLMNWNIEVDEAMFLGGLPKGEFLREFEPDFFFDDQTGHVDNAAPHVPSGHVAAGVTNGP